MDSIFFSNVLHVQSVFMASASGQAYRILLFLLLLFQVMNVTYGRSLSTGGSHTANWEGTGPLRISYRRVRRQDARGERSLPPYSQARDERSVALQSGTTHTQYITNYRGLTMVLLQNGTVKGTREPRPEMGKLFLSLKYKPVLFSSS